MEGSVKIECDNHVPHVMYADSHWFFAYMDASPSELTQFITMPQCENHLRPTFRAGDGIRVDGDLYMVVNYQIAAFPRPLASPDPGHLSPPTSTFVFVYHVAPVSDTNDIYPSKWWIKVPGEAHRVTGNDPRVKSDN